MYMRAVAQQSAVDFSFDIRTRPKFHGNTRWDTGLHLQTVFKCINPFMQMLIDLWEPMLSIVSGIVADETRCRCNTLLFNRQLSSFTDTRPQVTQAT